ncbi:MAG: pseudouridine-5'-phosphate glycosidase [Rhodobacteraceae bacterium]|nr:pseudouridine-5'-phosphate glycosidase [Paracoccaceae bacterium]
MNLPLSFSPEVMAAMAADTPIVALESTIITHGMPYPQNVETARMIEADIRDQGVTPATIAIMDGAIHIGLTDERLEDLAQSKDVLKLSRADLAFAVANGKTGATTVAATMICAHLAGIKVFATGGIGGVHRGSENTFDISADLEELAKTPVIVVGAGAKAILDLPKTLEILETRGVPVVTFGQDEFPAFWSRSSGLQSPLRADSVEEIAAAYNMRDTLDLDGGMFVANPIPLADEITSEYMAPVIEQAIAEATIQGVAAKSVTPFLLQRIFELTDGRSLTCNIALVKNNAQLATQIAKALKS